MLQQQQHFPQLYTVLHRLKRVVDRQVWLDVKPESLSTHLLNFTGFLYIYIDKLVELFWVESGFVNYDPMKPAT